MDLIGSPIFRAHAGIRAVRRWRAERMIDRYSPEIRWRYEALCAAIGSRPKTWQPERGVFLLRLLERYRPQRLAEMGSGVSTIWFATYCRKHRATLDSLEQNAAWGTIVSTVADSRVTVAPIKMQGKIARYSTPIPPGCDFIYVDGPASEESGKVICQDVIDYVARGERPKIIAFDGRTDTVAALQSLASGYAFEPEFIYAFQRRDWSQAMLCRPQTVFVRLEA